jgi:hypothetical protein
LIINTDEDVKQLQKILQPSIPEWYLMEEDETSLGRHYKPYLVELCKVRGLTTEGTKSVNQLL